MSVYDVIICGGGVGGLTLALALGRRGLSVLLLEKQRENVEIHKGELIQPRTLAICESLGILDDLRAHDGVHTYLFECRGAGGELLGAMDYRVLPAPHNYVMVQYYHTLRQVLWRHAQQHAELRTGARVEQLRFDARGRVCGVRFVHEGAAQEASAALVVGADGRISAVRQQLGIAVQHLPYDHQLLSFDIDLGRPLGPQIAVYLSPEGLRLVYPMPRRHCRLYVQIATGTFGAIREQGVARWLTGVFQRAPGLAMLSGYEQQAAETVQVQGAWRFSAPRWHVPGAALLGDAAHAVHPMAAQGLNAAIADAWDLTQRILQRRDGDALSDAAIDAACAAYERERRSQIDYVVRLSHSLSSLCTATSGWGRWLARRVVGSNRHNRRLQYALTYNMSGLGVYRFSMRDRLYQFGVLPDPRAAQPQL